MEASIDARKMKFIQRFFRMSDVLVIREFEALLNNQRLTEFETEMNRSFSVKELKKSRKEST